MERLSENFIRRNKTTKPNKQARNTGPARAEVSNDRKKDKKN